MVEGEAVDAPGLSTGPARVVRAALLGLAPQRLAGHRIPVERVERGPVRAEDVVAQLFGVPAGGRSVPRVSGDLAGPEQQGRVHEAVDDGPAALALVVEIAPRLDDAGR